MHAYRLWRESKESLMCSVKEEDSLSDEDLDSMGNELKFKWLTLEHHTKGQRMPVKDERVRTYRERNYYQEWTRYWKRRN